MLAAYSVYLNLKLLAYIVALLSFVTACTIMINESFTHQCTLEHLDNKKSDICKEFLDTTNLCKTISKPTDATTPSRHSDEFPQWIRLFSIILALLSLFSSIGTIVIYSFSMKAILLKHLLMYFM